MDITGLVSLWEMEGASGASETDLCGHDNLASNNTVGSAAGKVGNARTFVTNKYLSHASDSNLQMGDIDFCGGCWVKIHTIPLGGNSVMLLAKDTDSPANSRDYTLDYWGGNAFRFYFNGAIAVNASNFGAAAADTWYWVFFWHDAANDQIGICVNNTTPNTFSTSAVPQTSSAEFRIGARAYSGFEGYLDGSIDQVFLFKNRILNSTERATIYNSGSGRAFVGPAFTNSATASVQENQTGALTCTCSGDTPITFSITGGADAALFSVNSSTGVLTFLSAPDFESPSDANSDNAYVVQVTATGLIGSVSQTHTITVTDVAEGPPVGVLAYNRHRRVA